MKKSNPLTQEQQDALDYQGLAILEKFAENLRRGVSYQDESNAAVLQEHFDWAKTFLTTNKVAYLAYVKSLAGSPEAVAAINGIEAGLPYYVKSVAMFHIAKVN